MAVFDSSEMYAKRFELGIEFDYVRGIGAEKTDLIDVFAEHRISFTRCPQESGLWVFAALPLFYPLPHPVVVLSKVADLYKPSDFGSESGSHRFLFLATFPQLSRKCTDHGEQAADDNGE